MKKTFIIVLSLFFIFQFKVNVSASTQLYDYYEGVDDWLSNNLSYSPLGGSFSGKPNPPLNNMRALPNMSKIGDWENFYDYARFWSFNSNAEIQSLDNRYNMPHTVMKYTDDSNQHGIPYYDGSTPNDYCAYYYIFYKRPKPFFVYTKITGGNFYNDGSSYWVKPGESLWVTSKWFDNEGRIDLGKVYLQLSGDVNDTVYHRFNSSNVSGVSLDGNANFVSNGDSDCNGDGYGAVFQFSISKNNANVKISSSSENGQGTVYHYGNQNSEDWGGARDEQQFVDNFIVETDGDAPSYGRAYINNITSNSFDVYIDKVKDSRSGVKSIQFSVNDETYKGGESLGNGGYKYHVSGVDTNSNYSVNIKLTDNVGNSKVVKAPTAKPTANFVSQDNIFENEQLNISDTSISNDPEDIVDTNKKFQYSKDDGSTWSDLNLQQQTSEIQYSSHVSNEGWENWVNDGQISGNFNDQSTYHFEALKIDTYNNQVNGMGVRYRTHCANIGWQDWVSNGQQAGTTGQNLSLQALNIELTNAPQGFHILYQAYVQDYGWQNWVSDGAEAGTTGQGKAIIALRVKVVNLNYKLAAYSLEPGNYKIREKVQNMDSQRWSDWYTKNILVKSLIPLNGDLNVVQYDYKQDNNNYWVRPNSLFGVYTSGYFPSNYGIFPSRTYVLFAKGGTMASNSPRQYADIQNHYEYGDFDSCFNFLNNGDRAIEGTLNGNNYLSTVHRLSAKNDGDNFELYYTNSRMANKEYAASYQDSGKWIRVDGIAPGFLKNGSLNDSVNVNMVLDDNLNLSGTIFNLHDLGSGTKAVYAKCYPTGQENIAKTVYLTGSNDQWKLASLNAYDMFQSDDINVDIYTIDNVGNVGKIKSQRFDLVTVKAKIVPYNNQGSTEDVPTLQAGQKAILKIHTTGYPDTLQITFPPELVAKDSSLNKTINIVPKASLETDIEFTVPRYVDEKNYTVNVKAIKTITGKVKEANPEFKVSGDIFKGYHTVILYDNN